MNVRTSKSTAIGEFNFRKFQVQLKPQGLTKNKQLLLVSTFLILMVLEGNILVQTERNELSSVYSVTHIHNSPHNFLERQFRNMVHLSPQNHLTIRLTTSRVYTWNKSYHNLNTKNYIFWAHHNYICFGQMSTAPLSTHTSASIAIPILVIWSDSNRNSFN